MYSHFISQILSSHNRLSINNNSPLKKLLETKRQRQFNIWIPKCSLNNDSIFQLLDKNKGKMYKRSIGVNIIKRTSLNFNKSISTPRRIIKGITNVPLNLRLSLRNDISRSFDLTLLKNCKRELNQMFIIPKYSRGKTMRILPLRNRVRASTMEKICGYVNFRFGSTIKQNTWCRSLRSIYKGRKCMVPNAEVKGRRVSNFLTEARRNRLKMQLPFSASPN